MGTDIDDAMLAAAKQFLADEGLSMTAQTAVVHKDQTATVWATVEVSGLDKLSRVLHRLEGVRDVFSVVREVGKVPANNGRS